METKYTKGTWKISKSGAFIECENTPIASVSMSNTEQLANAKLIAAAPEILNVLIELRNWVCQLHDWSGGTSLDPPIERIDAVIKKATE